ncbi:sulfotransferase [Gemmatimonadota bacterium]
MKASRTAEFAKDAGYEALLEKVNEEVEGWGEEDDSTPSRTILFVVGAPRSGTTLLYQLLAATGSFHYPTNLIARFYRSPAWGGRMQRLLEPLLNRGDMSYSSRAGNTEQWWGPHEFGYFWEHHFDFRDHHEPEAPDLAGLVRSLAAFEKEGEGPLLFKNPILSFVVEDLARALPSARFLWTQRPSLDLAASIYQTRIRFHGDPGAWLSLRPRDAQEGAPPAEQIAHQIRRAHEALSRARDRLGDRFAEVDYLEICRRPEGALRIAEELVGTSLGGTHLPGSFTPSQPTSEPSVRRELEAALREEGML